MKTKKQFVSAILQLYLALPETASRLSKLDYRLAEDLYDKGISQQNIETAMLLTTARRLARSPQAPQLAPIRSLHYFMPALHEVTGKQMPAGYLEYLRTNLQGLLKKPVAGFRQSSQTE